MTIYFKHKDGTMPAQAKTKRGLPLMEGVDPNIKLDDDDRSFRQKNLDLLNEMGKARSKVLNQKKDNEEGENDNE